MTGLLSAEDEAALRGLGQGQVRAVVERIVARHVNAATDAAADALSAESRRWRDAFDVVRMQDATDYSAGRLGGQADAYWNAARIVRAAAERPPP